jgi:hypothetical protein
MGGHICTCDLKGMAVLCGPLHITSFTPNPTLPVLIFASVDNLTQPFRYVVECLLPFFLFGKTEVTGTVKKNVQR